MLLKRYIRFYDGVNNRESIIWWAGTTGHSAIWKMLHEHDKNVFEAHQTAGSAYYDGKKKQLITYDYSTSLNVMAMEEDGKLLSSQLFDKAQLRTYFARRFQDDAFDTDLVMVSEPYHEVVEAALAKHRLLSPVDLRFHKHSSEKPFVTKELDLKEKGWIEYAIDNLHH